MKHTDWYARKRRRAESVLEDARAMRPETEREQAPKQREDLLGRPPLATALGAALPASAGLGGAANKGAVPASTPGAPRLPKARQDHHARRAAYYKGYLDATRGNPPDPP